MGYRKFQQARLDAGLCLYCGAERGKGSTPLQCADCTAKDRARKRADYQRYLDNAEISHREMCNARRRNQRAEWRAAGCCYSCGRDRADSRTVYCPTCQQKQRCRQAGFRQRERNKITGGRYEFPAWPVGGAVPRLEGGQHVFRLGLTIPAVQALTKIYDRYKETERAAGRAPKTHQISRLVRWAVHCWRHLPCPRRPEGEVWVVEVHSVSLDGPSWRVVRWQAEQHFDGNVSAALRAIIINSVPPTVIGATGGPRRWRPEPWEPRRSGFDGC
jgi:hypothetical protein